MSNLPANTTYIQDECCDNLENNATDTNIQLPDGRHLWELNGELYTVHLETQIFERYDPILQLPWDEKMARIRKIVTDKQYAMVEGVMVDLFSASAIMAVFDSPALSQKHRLKFMSLRIPRMAELAFKLVK